MSGNGSSDQLLLFAKCRKQAWCRRPDAHKGKCERGLVAEAVRKADADGVTGAMMAHTADILDSLASDPEPSSARYWGGIVRTMRDLANDAGLTGDQKSGILEEINALTPPG